MMISYEKNSSIASFHTDDCDNDSVYLCLSSKKCIEWLMRVIAKTNHFTDNELEDMRREAINNVRRTRGKIKLEDIAKGWYNEE